MKHELRLLALAASLAAGNALAAPIDLGAKASVNTSSQSNTGMPLSSASAFEGNVEVGNGSANAFANQYSAYAAGAYATGSLFDSNASASVLHRITNDTGVAQHYSLTFKLYGGYIATQLNSETPLSAGESLVASYLATIKFNGNTIFSSGASLQRTDTGISFSRSGEDLNPGDDGADGFYSWATQYVTLDLGVLAAGASFDLLAELGDRAYSDVGYYEYDGGGDGYGCGGYDGYDAMADTDAVTCYGFKGEASAFYGDPFDFNAGEGDEALVFTRNAATVSEPGMLALAGLGLFAAGWSRRRQSA